MATIRETRIANAKRKEQEAKDDAEAQAKIDAIRNKRKPKSEKKKESKSFLDKIRDALSPDDEADADAIAAIERGIKEADEADKD